MSAFTRHYLSLENLLLRSITSLTYSMKLGHFVIYNCKLQNKYFSKPTILLFMLSSLSVNT